jgi:hypothetical protein
MLKSVYEPDEELSRMFETINQFLERKNAIIELKRAYHFSDLAVQSAKMVLQVDSVVGIAIWQTNKCRREIILNTSIAKALHWSNIT